MDLLKPVYLYLLLLIPLLLLLYVLKLRRKTYVVSSCVLWEQAIEDMKANTPFQRLRRNLLLPLQIVFLTLMVFALARPFWRGAAYAAQNTILLIDGSASMKATDTGETRFEMAKSAGRDWELEYRIRHAGGEVRWVLEKGRGVAGDDGAIAYLDGFILDITEQKTALEALRRVKEETEALNRRLAEQTAGREEAETAAPTAGPEEAAAEAEEPPDEEQGTPLFGTPPAFDDDELDIPSFIRQPEEGREE